MLLEFLCSSTEGVIETFQGAGYSGQLCLDVLDVGQHTSDFLLQLDADCWFQILPRRGQCLFTGGGHWPGLLAPTEKLSAVDAVWQRHRFAAVYLIDGGSQCFLVGHSRARVDRCTWCRVDIEVLGSAFGQRSIDLLSTWAPHSRPANAEERSTQNRISGQRHAVHDLVLSCLGGVTVGFKQLS
ncbi:hypothetical protein D3C77_433190 [compost metagenome]